jgi:(E)-4-hydroxy-3-methylbut-2-enyl-diphosphate synthase
MVSAPPHNAGAVVRQVRALERAGCEIVRIAVPDRKAAAVFATVREKVGVPLIADIHFNKELALLALDAGAHGIRVNPGNLGGNDAFRAVLAAASKTGACIRIGVNAGSLPDDVLKRHGGPLPAALVEAAQRFAEIAEKKRFSNYKVSLKASDVAATIDAYRMFSKLSDAPLHIGITEAGGAFAGGVRTAVGLGVLLGGGIGDTLRVSLAAPPVQEVRAGWLILGALGLRHRGALVVACPMCGRAGADIAPVVRRVEHHVQNVRAPVKIAIMGCPVNGPGEAREADVGAALGKASASIFKKGEVIKKVPKDQLVPELLRQIDDIVREAESK